jgi:hypothetical protein
LGFQLRQGSPFIRNAFFLRLVLARIQVECLSAVEATPSRDIIFWHAIRHRYDELRAQRDYRNWQ